MQRTQVYLSELDLAVLDREAKRTGRTRSQLIRDAVERTFGTPTSPDDWERTLREAAGVLKDAPFTGEEYVRAIRTHGFGALEELWPEWYGADADRPR